MKTITTFQTSGVVRNSRLRKTPTVLLKTLLYFMLILAVPLVGRSSDATRSDGGVLPASDMVFKPFAGMNNAPSADVSDAAASSTPVMPVTVKVCYNSDQYGISGQWMSFADDKLINPNNWGASGIDTRYQFELFSFGTGAITEAALIANGCQIFYAGGNNNDAGTFNPGATNALSAADKNEIRNWGASPNNVVITAQGYAAFMGGAEYSGASGSPNPNTLTPLGEVVISGVFGTTNPFNQGGTYRGRFTAFPTTACVITQDNNGSPTGLLDGTRGDFYFSDFDMLSELGGLSSNAGISTNTDVFFANLFSSAAQVAIEGPSNGCSFFLCTPSTMAPGLNTGSVSSAGTPVDLNTTYTDTPPLGTILTWHNASPAADDNFIGNSTSYTRSGTVYATYRTQDGGCYGPETPLVVSIDYPDLEVTIAPSSGISAPGEVQNYTVTVTNNGPITAPDAVVKVPIPAGRQLILASPSAGSYSGSSYLWEVGELINGQSETLAITIRLQ